MRALHAECLAEPGPFLKWAGGKGQLLDELALLCPERAAVRTYHEPFLGGGALYFHLRPQRAFLQDLNVDLIETYDVVRSDVEALIKTLDRLDARHSAIYYYTARTRWNTERRSLSPIDRAALFVYLNKRGFNGLWRVNSRGENNVPVGRSTIRRICDPDRLRVDAELLRGARLKAAPFESVLDRAKAGDFVYLDPPYHPVSATASFTAYQRGGFGASDQERLAELFAELDRRGCFVMLSNSDCPFIRKLYRGYDRTRVHAVRAINSKASARGAVAELIIRNYP